MRKSSTLGGLRARIIAEARSWLGTPFVHQGRRKGEEADCTGHIIGVARALGFCAPDFDVTGYSDTPRTKEMEIRLDQYLERVPFGEEKPGDIAWIRVKREVTHLAFLTDRGTLVHALASMDEKHGRVAEHRFDIHWRHRVVRFYKFPGIDE